MVDDLKKQCYFPMHWTLSEQYEIENVMRDTVTIKLNFLMWKVNIEIQSFKRILEPAVYFQKHQTIRWRLLREQCTESCTKLLYLTCNNVSSPTVKHYLNSLLQVPFNTYFVVGVSITAFVHWLLFCRWSTLLVYKRKWKSSSLPIHVFNFCNCSSKYFIRLLTYLLPVRFINSSVNGYLLLR